MPVLKVNPLTGEGLDKSKTVEQLRAEEAAHAAEIAKIKQKKPRKKKSKVAVVPEPVLKVNPVIAPVSSPSVDDLIKPFNKLLSKIDKQLKKVTQGYRIVKDIEDDNLKIVLKRPKASVKVTYNSDYIANIHIPIGFEADSTITGIPLNEDVFQLKSEVIKPRKNLVVDRLFFNVIDVQNMLKFPKESLKLLEDLILKMMFQNIVYVKYLSTGNEYIGSIVASIEIPGQKQQYALNFKDEIIEVRMWSDLTEISKGEVK